MKTLYLIRGKSTLAYQLLDGFISSKIAADGVSEREWFAVSSKLVTVSKI